MAELIVSIAILLGVYCFLCKDGPKGGDEHKESDKQEQIDAPDNAY